MHRGLKGRLHWVLKATGTALSLGLAAYAFRTVHISDVVLSVRKVGGGIWLVPLPFALAQMTETYAWQAAFKAFGHGVSYGPLLRVRLACESIAQTVPGGMLIAETLKPALLMSQCGLAPSEAVCGTAARKLLLLVSQCGYFALGVLLGFPALRTAGSSAGAGRWLPLYVATVWLVLVLSAIALTLALQRGSICGRVLSLLKRIPLPTMRAAADRWRAGLLRTDSRFAAFCALGPQRLARSTALYLLAWLWEAAETSLLLTLLGVKLDFGTFCLIEVCASMIRHVAFMAPAGLGVQDVSYAVLLHVFGVNDWLSVAASFTLLKRSKELLWAALGYALLATMRPTSPSSRDFSAVPLGT
jgi:hypothetical protein